MTQMGNTGHAERGRSAWPREWLEAGAIGPVRKRFIAGQIVRASGGPKILTGRLRRRRFPPRSTGISGSVLHCAALLEAVSSVCLARMVRLWYRHLGDMAIHNMDPAFYSLDLGIAWQSKPGRANSNRNRIRSGRCSGTNSPPKAIGRR